MEVVVKEIVVPKNVHRIHLEPLGDIHIGSRLFDRQKFLERLNAIKNDRTRYWLGMGDYIDNIRPYKGGTIDKRWNYSVIDREYMTPEEQLTAFVNLVKPIANKCLGLLWGNHEWNTIDYDEFNERVCRRLGVPFLGSMAFVQLRIRRQDVKRTVIIWACHGSYAGMRRGGAVNRLEELSAKYDADIYLHAHTHYKDFFPGEGYGLDENGNLITWNKMYALTGTFMRQHVVGIESYHERHPSLRVSRLGTITIGIDIETGKLHGFE